MSRQNRVILLYTTCASEQQAQKLAEMLLSEKLIACANIFPHMTSLYMWEGKMQNENEVAMICKSSEEQKAALMKRAQEGHPYEVPALIILNSAECAGPYTNWLMQQMA